MTSTERDAADVIALPPLIYLAALLVAWLLHVVAPVPLLPRFLAPLAAAALVAVAAVIGLSGARALRRAGTTISVHEPSTAIVVDGPYRYSRNPLYAALTLLYLALGAAALNTLWALVLLPPLVVVIRRGVIEREERYLGRKFGEEYLRYKGRVRRWL